jgi:hypothetical protein
MNGIDPTLVIEHLARRLRRGGAAHPVAAAISLAARGATCLAAPEFSTLVDLPVETVARSERGEISFGELAPSIGAAAAATGADLLALADLSLEWRGAPYPDVSGG